MAWRAASTAWLVAILLLLLLYASGQARTQEPPTNAPPGIDLPLFLDNRELGEVDVQFSRDNELISIDGRAVLDLLRDIILPANYGDFERRLDQRGRLSREALASLAVGLEYDAAKLELVLSIPPEMRRRVEVHLGTGSPFGGKPIPVTPPASTSAYVNVRTAADYLGGGQAAGWQPALLDLDGAATVLGTTLEGTATFRGGATGGWTRGDVRLVRDFVASRIRVTAGDLAYGVDGFQGFYGMGGLSVGRDFDLQPYRSSKPAGETTVLVERSSRVDVLVNGRRVETLDIGPGRYNVRDFPFAPGANDVSLRLTDDAGRVQILNFPFVYDATVLANGVHDFHYAAGFESESTRAGRRYDTSRPLLSFYHALGINDQLTLGANAQASSRARLGGVEARWATRVGTFRGDFGMSAATTRPTGYAARLQYRYLDTVGESSAGRTLEISTSYRSRTFTGLSTTTANNPVSIDAGARYGQRLFGTVYGAAGLSWQKGRGSTRDAYAADFSVSSPIADGLSAYVLVSRNRSAVGRGENRIFAAISWFPGGGHSTSASHDSRTGHTRAQWHYHPSRAVEAWETDVLTERGPTASTVRSEVNYTDYRFRAGLYHSREYGRGGGSDQQRTNLTVGSALAFADGHFAVSRPIADSFALIVPHPALKDQRVEVNPGPHAPQALVDGLGAAVLPELTSYYRHQILLDAPELPDGLDLGQDFYTLQPEYRTGTVIAAGTGATVLLDAAFVDATGAAMGLELGSAAVEALPDRAPVEFFTSREGRMRIAGVAPGNITIYFANYPDTPVMIGVPENTVGFFNAGQIAVPVIAVPSMEE